MPSYVAKTDRTQLRDRVRILDLLDSQQAVMTYTEIANVLRVCPKRCRIAVEALEATGEVFCRRILASNGRIARFWGTETDGGTD